MPHSGELAFQLPPEPFTAPALLNAWAVYGASFTPPGYYKDPDGVVHLRGLIKDGTVGLVAFTLPPGYRPSGTLIFSSITSTGAGRLDVLATGDVVPQSGGNGYFTLSGMDFRV